MKQHNSFFLYLSTQKHVIYCNELWEVEKIYITDKDKIYLKLKGRNFLVPGNDVEFIISLIER